MGDYRSTLSVVVLAVPTLSAAWCLMPRGFVGLLGAVLTVLFVVAIEREHSEARARRSLRALAPRVADPLPDRDCALRSLRQREGDCTCGVAFWRRRGEALACWLPHASDCPQGCAAQQREGA